MPSYCHRVYLGKISKSMFLTLKMHTLHSSSKAMEVDVDYSQSKTAYVKRKKWNGTVEVRLKVVFCQHFQSNIKSELTKVLVSAFNWRPINSHERNV